MSEVPHKIPSTYVLEHQVDIKRFFNDSFWINLPKICPVKPSKIHLIEFDDVPMHVDIVSTDMIYSHLVLSGVFEFHTGDEIIRCFPGDWLKMIPSKPHTVVSYSRVITLCMESYANGA